MRTLVATAVVAAVGGLGAAMNPNGELRAQGGGRPTVEHRAFDIEGHGAMPYAVSVPAGYDPAAPHPLVLALHPGGTQGSYYGSRNMQTIFEPALRDLDAVVVAPDAPTRRWATDVSDRGVMALLNEIAEEYNIDRSRVLVTGFSLGGRGTWFFATRHPDFFTGAIPIAGRPGDDPLDALGDMPVHIIHSRADEVVPVGPAEDAANQLRDAGGNVVFTALDGIGHFTMGAYVPALRDAGEWIEQQWAAR